jgi:hypothetical protein
MKQIVTPSLEEAKKRISNWRATRTKRRPIPDEVWDAVLPLIGQHSYSNISRELGLSYLQIRNKIEMVKETPTSTQKPFISIALPQETTFVRERANGCKVAFTKPDGATLAIESAPEHLINEIVAHFVGKSC